MLRRDRSSAMATPVRGPSSDDGASPSSASPTGADGTGAPWPGRRCARAGEATRPAPGQAMRPGRLGDRQPAGRREAAGDVLPVHDVPEGVEERRLYVPVLQVVRVLPRVEGQERDRAVPDASL